MYSSIPILRIGHTLLVTIQVELRDTVAEAFQESVLAKISETAAAGLVIDITALEVVDSYVARVITELGRMARLMGTETALVGMRPELAATLVRMGYKLEGVHTALDIDEGLALVRRMVRSRRRGARS